MLLSYDQSSEKCKLTKEIFDINNNISYLTKIVLMVWSNSKPNICIEMNVFIISSMDQSYRSIQKRITKMSP
jgi:hypothetical protein